MPCENKFARVNLEVLIKIFFYTLIAKLIAINDMK